MGGFLELLTGKQAPLQESWGTCLEMLDTTAEMVRLACSCRGAGADGPKHLRRLHEMDTRVNRQQEEIRRKVFTHLTVAEARDVATALRILAVATHLERVGDYAKNVAEVYLLLHHGLQLGEEQQEVLQNLDTQIGQAFVITRGALVEADAERVDEVTEICGSISTASKRAIEGTICGDGEDDRDRGALAYVLLLRHQKRIASHLKHTARGIVEPIHKLG